MRLFRIPLGRKARRAKQGRKAAERRPEGHEHLRPYRLCRRPDGLRQDEAGRRAGQTAGRRGRFLRLHAALPQHGCRHGQADRRGNAGRPAPHAGRRGAGRGFFRGALRRNGGRLRAGHSFARKNRHSGRRHGPVCRQPDRRAELRAVPGDRKARGAGRAPAAGGACRRCTRSFPRSIRRRRRGCRWAMRAASCARSRSIRRPAEPSRSTTRRRKGSRRATVRSGSA